MGSPTGVLMPAAVIVLPASLALRGGHRWNEHRAGRGGPPGATAYEVFGWSGFRQNGQVP